jgi:putative transcriptional regulator
MNKKIFQKTISLEEFTQGFTDKQKKIVENEMRYYDVLNSLKKIRKEVGLTQAELASKADIPRTTVTKIESGKYNPTLSTLMVLAQALDKQLQIRLV